MPRCSTAQNSAGAMPRIQANAPTPLSAESMRVTDAGIIYSPRARFSGALRRSEQIRRTEERVLVEPRADRRRRKECRCVRHPFPLSRCCLCWSRRVSWSLSAELGCNSHAIKIECVESLSLTGKCCRFASRNFLNRFTTLRTRRTVLPAKLPADDCSLKRAFCYGA